MNRSQQVKTSNDNAKEWTKEYIGLDAPEINSKGQCSDGSEPHFVVQSARAVNWNSPKLKDQNKSGSNGIAMDEPGITLSVEQRA